MVVGDRFNGTYERKEDKRKFEMKEDGMGA